MKIIYYYQTFVGLDKIIEDDNNIVTHIHLSSIHFGLNDNAKPYIHLNDDDPRNKKFNNVWDDLRKCKKKGIKVILMVGGAGGAYEVMFSKYSIYKTLLFDVIDKYKDVIDGIDLDVEEYITLGNIILLKNDIHLKYGSNFIISMTPLVDSIMSNDPGMGGFSYKDLYNSIVGKHITYFNVQCYGSFNLDNYKKMLSNGYPTEMINMGMLSSMDMDSALDTIKDIIKAGYVLGGVYNWEYYNSPPDGEKNPITWSKEIYKAIHPKTSYIKAYFAYYISLITTLFKL